MNNKGHNQNRVEDTLDLESGYDSLSFNGVAFSTLTRQLLSIDEDSVQLNFYSDESISYYQGLNMTLMLGDYGKGLHLTKTN